MSSSKQTPTPRNRTRWLAVGAAVVAVATLAGCATHSASGNVYSYNQAQREQISRNGTVLNVRSVVIQPERTTGVGTIAGAALGGLAGSTIGGGTGRAIASVVGGVAGGVAGTQIEKGAARKAAYEITVRFDNGETRVITQEADIALHQGQRVQVVSGAGPTRVIPVR